MSSVNLDVFWFSLAMTLRFILKFLLILLGPSRPVFYSSLNVRSSILVFHLNPVLGFHVITKRKMQVLEGGEGNLREHGVTRVEKCKYLPVIPAHVHLFLVSLDLNWSKRSAFMESFLLEMLWLHFDAFSSVFKNGVETCWDECLKMTPSLIWA